VDAQALRARLAARNLGGPIAPIGPAQDAPLPAAFAAPADTADARRLIEGTPVPCAVLVPFLPDPVSGVLLTKRTAHLSNHAGQVSFPGGRIEACDRGPEAAALREAQEEIGLDPARVELLGRLDDYVTGSGYSISPVLGLLPVGMGLNGLGLVLSPDEVEAVFVLPLAVLLDPDAPRRQRAEYQGRWRDFWVWPHPEHYIWGATAAILVRLATLLRGE
jgi:8-oxo-dGTP pyrophosphatase MutT (NUDIX family)